MPELPEVETITRQLDVHLKNKVIADIEILSEKNFIGDPNVLKNQKVVSVSRRAKNLIFSFGTDLYMLVHLKMTGQLIYVASEGRVAGGHPSHDFHDKLPNKHTRVIFSFTDRSKLFYNDMRKFGWCRVVSKKELDDYFADFGPDASPLVKAEYLMEQAKSLKKTNIKEFLLNQNIISGIGNIYTDEILYEMRLHPETLVSKLKKADWEKLAKVIDEKLRQAIAKGGTTDSDYVNANGEKGGMQNYLNVYHRTGEPCPRDCGGKIERIKVAGRGTHYCPVCQKKRK
jgi:formamidopyrimidine-DNA glycosylase